MNVLLDCPERLAAVLLNTVVVVLGGQEDATMARVAQAMDGHCLLPLVLSGFDGPRRDVGAQAGVHRIPVPSAVDPEGSLHAGKLS